MSCRNDERAETWTLLIRCPTGSAPARLTLVQKYIAQLGLIVVGVEKPHRIDGERRSDPRPTSESAGHPKRAISRPRPPTDEIADYDPEWVAAVVAEQSRRNLE